MAKVKIIPEIAPGSEIIAHCLKADKGCKSTVKLTPSDEHVFPKKLVFTCGACAGIENEWTMSKGKSKKVMSRAPGQKTLEDATEETVDE